MSECDYVVLWHISTRATMGVCMILINRKVNFINYRCISLCNSKAERNQHDPLELL